MSERYYITGVQIGMLKAFLGSKEEVNLKEIKKLIDEIEDKQFVGKITTPEEKVIIAG